MRISKLALTLLLPVGLAASTLLVTPVTAHAQGFINAYNDESGLDQTILEFHNTSAFDYTNVTLTGFGYQPNKVNTGLTDTISLPNILAGTTVSTVDFANASGMNNYDYLPFGVGAFGDYDDFNYGNFTITFNAIANGQAITSTFSPNDNLTGMFVPFESVADDGNEFDDNTPNQTLGNVTPVAVPEPGSIALLVGMGTVGAAFLRRRKAVKNAA